LYTPNSIFEDATDGTFSVHQPPYLMLWKDILPAMPLMIPWSAKPICQPGTRERVIKEVLEWAEGDNVCLICWLHGPAGSGKSMIAHTIAERLRHKLAASFFFSRGKAGRSDTATFFPTLAYQIATYLVPVQMPML
jgi:hypothetical protein